MKVEERKVGAAERRFFQSPITTVKRAAVEGESPEMVIGGVSARMESRTLLWEWDDYKVYEEIAPGAFDDVLNNDCRCLFNHNSSNVLGRTTNETLKLQVVDNELRFESVLPNTQTARDVYELVSRGDVNQCSFQFTIETEDRLEISPKEVVYRITKIKQLYDVGPVTFPAYQDTTVSARDIEKIKEELMQREKPPVERNKKWKNFLRLANTTQQ